jgi:hypothetical protein
LERYRTGRFWKGVAQITRSRDRTFIASHCSERLFAISSVRRADRCLGTAARRFSPLHVDSNPNRAAQATGRREKSGPKTSEKATAAFGSDWRVATSPTRSDHDRPGTRRRLAMWHDGAALRMTGLRKPLIFRAQNVVRSLSRATATSLHRAPHQSNPARWRIGKSRRAPIGKSESSNPERTMRMAAKRAMPETTAPHLSTRVPIRRRPPACSIGRNCGSKTPQTLHSRKRASANLPLAARGCVGHIDLNGAVAEWLKAAVC